MTDQELNKALALALGHGEGDIEILQTFATLTKPPRIAVFVTHYLDHTHDFFQRREFDYRDTAVILPIVIKYGIGVELFRTTNEWCVIHNNKPFIIDESYHRAVAISVIQLKRRGVI